MVAEIVDRKEQKKLRKEAKGFLKNLKGMTWEAYFKGFRLLAKSRKLDILEDIDGMEKAVKENDDEKYRYHFQRIESEMLPTLSALSRTHTPKEALLRMFGIRKKEKKT